MPRVLVLEPNQIIADINCEYISDHGGEALWAQDERTAIDVLTQFELDAAVIDVSSCEDPLIFLNLPKVLKLKTVVTVSTLMETPDYPVKVVNKMTPLELFDWLDAEVLS